MDLETHYENSIFSPDPAENPAFFDYNIGREKSLFGDLINQFLSAYVPYCSSDCYTGRKNASLVTDNLTFHGHYIVEALLADLMKNTWIAEAEEVKMMLLDLESSIYSI